MRLENLISDTGEVEAARKAALQVIERDPLLARPEHAELVRIMHIIRKWYRNKRVCLPGLLACLLFISHNAFARQWPESQTATIYSNAAATPYQPQGGATQSVVTCQGLTTVLECRQTLAKMPRHDMDSGRTEVVLSTKDGKQVLLREILAEVWECLGFNPRTRQYVIVTKNEHGVKVTLRGLLYVDEAKAAFQDSVFDKKRMEAATSLYGPEGGYLVLIGAPEESGKYALYSLDTNTDQLKLLGKPPAPPPLTKEDLEYPDAVEMMGAWEAPERHYCELEKGIWQFTGPHTLQVSYGKDTVKARSKKRKIVRFDLRKQ